MTCPCYSSCLCIPVYFLNLPVVNGQCFFNPSQYCSAIHYLITSLTCSCRHHEGSSSFFQSSLNFLLKMLHIHFSFWVAVNQVHIVRAKTKKRCHFFYRIMGIFWGEEYKSRKTMQTFVLWQRSTFTAFAHLLVIVFYIHIYKICMYHRDTNRKRG